VKESPREELAIGDFDKKKNTVVGGLIVRGPSGALHKVLVGTNTMAGWAGEKYPNQTFHGNFGKMAETCGRTPATGCMYNLVRDPGEHVNIASKFPIFFQQMIKKIDDMQKSTFNPDRGNSDPAACKLALKKYHGFWGPFVDIESEKEVLV